MELGTFAIPFSAGNVFYRVRHREFRWKNARNRGCVCSLNSPEHNLCVPSPTDLLTGKVVYSVAPAMGHNKDLHPECNSRVPAITSALANMRLTPEFRSSEIFELQKFRPATVDDIARVHKSAYVSGLEKPAAHIASNPTFHERTKHIELDCYFIRDHVTRGSIHLMPVRSNHQLADIFTKPLPSTPSSSIISKLQVKDIYSISACEGVLEEKNKSVIMK